MPLYQQAVTEEIRIMTIRKGWRVTFEVVTPESAEMGDFERSGFVEPGEWHYSLGDESTDGMTLREAMTVCNPQEDSGSWFSECDGRDNYQTGENERRSLHPPRNITPASYARVARLLKL